MTDPEALAIEREEMLELFAEWLTNNYAWAEDALVQCDDDDEAIRCARSMLEGLGES